MEPGPVCGWAGYICYYVWTLNTPPKARAGSPGGRTQGTGDPSREDTAEIRARPQNLPDS